VDLIGQDPLEHPGFTAAAVVNRLNGGSLNQLFE
jgi:hypothetical protein